MPEPLVNSNGITVRQLKEWLDKLEDDEEATIWVDINRLSNQVLEVYPSSKGDIFLCVSLS